MTKSYVSMEQKVCYVCGRAFDTGSILMDMRLKDSFERHTVTGYGMCPDDAKRYSDGFIALVGVNASKSAFSGFNMSFENAHRTGRIIHIRATALAKIITVPLPLKKDGHYQEMIFVDDEVIDKITSMVDPDAE